MTQITCPNCAHPIHIKTTIKTTFGTMSDEERDRVVAVFRAKREALEAQRAGERVVRVVRR